MGAPPILREVYRQHLEHFGEPTNSIRFDDGKKQAGWPDLIDVFIWDPEPDLDITTFSTIGMSAEPLPGVSHRAELHFAVRQQINPEVQKNMRSSWPTSPCIHSITPQPLTGGTD